MAALALVTGPAGSGKTERLIQRAAERYEADRFASTLVLVPTARHGDQFRRRLVSCCGVALALDVLTLALFTRRYVSANMPPYEVVAELLWRVTRERTASGEAQRFQPIAETPGLHELVGSAVGELVAAGIEGGELRGAARRTASADHIALADIYTAYRAALDDHGWRDPREAAAFAADAIEQASDVPGLVLVDSLELLSAPEIRLLAALAERTEVAIALDPEGSERARWTAERIEQLVPGAQREQLPPQASSAAISAHTAANTEAQLRGIARAIKRTLTEDASLRPSDVAVVFRQATPHLSLARRVFQEYDLPFDPAAGERIASRPFGTWVLALLRLPAHDWRLTRLAELLRSSFLDRSRLEIEGDSVDHAIRAGRAHRLLSGLDALRELPHALELDAQTAEQDGRDGYAARLRVAGRAIGTAGARLTALLDVAPQSASAWAAALDDVLFGADGLARSAVDGYDTLEVEIAALRSDLDALRAIDEALGGPVISLDAFADDLERRMQRAATLIREAGGVLFAPMHTLHGLRFAHVFVGGLVEGEFPAPRRAPALLDQRPRELLRAAGLDLLPEPRASEDELWRVASSRAEAGISLWRPRLDDAGRPAASSYYLHEAGVEPVDEPPAVQPPEAASARELAVALSARWRVGELRRPRDLAAWPLVVRAAAPVEQRRRSFDGAGAHEGAITGADVGWLTNEEARWSASRLESYRTCAFQFFSRYALHLYEVEEELGEADAAMRGTVVHEILEDAVVPLAADGRPLIPDTVDLVIERVRSVGRRLWDDAPSRHAFGRAALWRFGWDEVLEDLERLLHREAATNATLGVERVVRQELPIDVALPGVDPELRLVGSIDRVDEGEGFAQIVDYKSGRPIRRADVEAGRRLQLQLYALAAGRQLDAQRLVARYAYLDPRADDWLLDTARDADRALIDEVATIAAATRASVAAADFRVDPQVPCPSYCDFRHICRVNQFTRSKQWS